MTKNEAATLETVATMGWERFTIRMLREALGFSYHQTYRIPHGYASWGTAYSGLLEKCPCSLPGLEQRAMVWLDEDPDNQNGVSHVFTFSPGFHQKSGKSVNEDPGNNDEDCSIGEICTDQRSNLHQFLGTESMSAGAGDLTLGVCDIRSGENIPIIPEEIRLIREPATYGGFSGCKSGCKDVKTGENVQPSVPVNPTTRTGRCSNSGSRNPVGFSNSASLERRSLLTERVLREMRLNERQVLAVNHLKTQGRDVTDRASVREGAGDQEQLTLCRPLPKSLKIATAELGVRPPGAPRCGTQLPRAFALPPPQGSLRSPRTPGDPGSMPNSCRRSAQQ